MSAADDKTRERSVWGSPQVPVSAAVAQVPVMGFELWQYFRGEAGPFSVLVGCGFSYFLVAVCGFLLVKRQASGDLEGFPQLPQFLLDRPVLTGFAAAGAAQQLAMTVAWLLR